MVMARKSKNNKPKAESKEEEKTSFEEESSLPGQQPLDDVDDLLTELDDDAVIDEPDEILLAKEEEVSELPDDESLELLKPTFEAELGEDPVRLYLREIGEIELLTVDHEFWLATRIEAARRGNVLNRDHPIARGVRTYSP